MKTVIGAATATDANVVAVASVGGGGGGCGGDTLFVTYRVATNDMNLWGYGLAIFYWQTNAFES